MIKKPQGFTLAETLFAMAIVAFSILSIIGMIPAGLSSLQSAERRAAEARILQTLSADFGAKSWRDARISATGSALYFDRNGVAIENNLDDAAYAAEVEIDPSPASMLLPGEEVASPYLMHLRVAITDRPRDQSALNVSQKAGAKRREFGLVIVNREPDK